MPTRVYLDHNATAPLHPAAREAMCAAFDLCGNASSVHAEGRAARAVIETARVEIGAFAGVAPKNIVFTSGGTEALNLALTPSFRDGADETGPSTCSWQAPGNIRPSSRAIVFRRRKLNLLGLTPRGVLDIEALDAALARASARGGALCWPFRPPTTRRGLFSPSRRRRR